MILKFGPHFSFQASQQAMDTCSRIITYIQNSGSLSSISLLFRPSWRKFINLCGVDSGKPAKIEHFQAILAMLKTSLLREELILRWRRQIGAIGGQELSQAEPELTAKSLETEIIRAAQWAQSEWAKFELQLLNNGFQLNAAIEAAALNQQKDNFVDKMQNVVSSIILPALEARKNWHFRMQIENRYQNLMTSLRSKCLGPSNEKMYFCALIDAADKLASSEYIATFNKYIELQSKVTIFQKRTALLNKLNLVAPGWANAIKSRLIQHCANRLPSDDVLLAWNIAQFKQEINLRNVKDYAFVQKSIQKLKIDLADTNALYVEKLTWRFQLRRIGLRENQALKGWQQMQNKITKSGTGKRDARFIRESRKLLNECRNAVPVWIMPLSRVFESFELGQPKFDLLILDEASQCDLKGLVAFSIAKQVLVVGDNAQVTPSAVGQESTAIQILIDEKLKGIPNCDLYDGKTSVYDIADQSFGETIRLVEHFRCVPDIIEFSNQLSYNGEILPLREASSGRFTEHLIAHRVNGAECENKINRIEALEIVSIIAAMVESSEYENSSIGVISMVGEEQAFEINSLLQRRIPTDKYHSHKLLCGNASHFQGDERDVMFLSMVETCDNPPLNLLQRGVRLPFDVCMIL